MERIKDAVRQRNMRRQNMPQASNNFNLIIYKQASPIDTKWSWSLVVDLL